MNDDQIDDLKQFIDTRISQSETLLREELGGDIRNLKEEMHDGFSGVGDAIEQINEKIDKNDSKTDLRLTHLEKQAV